MSNLTQHDAIILADADYVDFSYVRFSAIELTDWRAAQQVKVKGKSNE